MLSSINGSLPRGLPGNRFPIARTTGAPETAPRKGFFSSHSTPLRPRRVFTIFATMTKLKAFVAESVSPLEFYNRDWEGHIVEEIVRVLNGKTSYRIVLNAEVLRKAIKTGSENEYNIFHLSCHGDEGGIQLSHKTDISWDELADCSQTPDRIPPALILSSCIGCDRGIALAFKDRTRRPEVI